MASLAAKLFPYRASILAAGLGAFLLGVFPLVGVVQGEATLARWHVVCFAASVPVSLWALGLACLACFFHPEHGVVERLGQRGRKWLRAYALFTVWAFAAAPLVIFVTAGV